MENQILCFILVLGTAVLNWEIIIKEKDGSIPNEE